MQRIQEVTVLFFGPVTLAYLAACLFILGTQKVFPKIWPGRALPQPEKPYWETALGLAASIAILLIGNFLRLDKFLSVSLEEPWKGLVWMLTNLEVFAPIFLTLYFRKQAVETVYIGKDNILIKVLIGLLIGVISSLLFVLMRSEIRRMPEIMDGSVTWTSLTNFPAVFLEGVAVAFLFVRLQWTFGIRTAILIPSMLFAFSHIPGSLANGSPTVEIISFFFLNISICGFVLFTCYRTKDVITIGIVHYLMDVTIKSFNS